MNNTKDQALQKVKLTDIASIKTGKLNSNAANKNGKYPFFTCSQEIYRIDTFSFDTECVLLGGNNANGIYPLKYYKGKFNAYQRTYVIEAKNQMHLSTRYLFYALNLQLETLKGISTGAATKFLTLGILNTIEVPLPKLTTQQKIAAILSAYDDLIENNSRRIAILEEMAQALYREWFVEFRFPGHKRVAMVEGSDGRLMPEGWRIIPFTELIDFSIGGDWGSEEQTRDHDVKVSIIRGTDFKQICRGRTNEVPSRYIKRSSLNKRKLKKSDIIIENSINAKTRTSGSSLFITPGVLNLFENTSIICASFCRLFRLKNPRISPIFFSKLQLLFKSGDMAYYQNVAANGIANFQSKRLIKKESLFLPINENYLNKILEQLSPLLT